MTTSPLLFSEKMLQDRATREALIFLNSPVENLKGLGPGGRFLLKKLHIKTLKDLLFHLPSNVQTRTFVTQLSQTMVGQLVTLDVQIENHFPPAKRGPYRVLGRHENNFMNIVFFHAKGSYLKEKLPLGQRRLISGTLEFYDGAFQITHPDFIGSPTAKPFWEGAEAIYPLTQGLLAKQLREWIQATLKRLPPLPDWHSAEFLARNNWPSLQEALRQVHHPTSEKDLDPHSPARMRLAYDELLAHQWAMQQSRTNHRAQPGQILQEKDATLQRLTALLPFEFTSDQRRAMQEIQTDLQAPFAMKRLLQGDVGSGKTLVALYAMAYAASAGKQSALLAPTEILAQQHLETFKPLVEKLGLSVALLTGKTTKKERDRMAISLQEGTLSMLIGTHALCEKNVQFKNLGLVVIDEQHRFGVEQRLELTQKEPGINVLSMTATPIPRTLFMCSMGEMETSLLQEKPPGRQDIQTLLFSLDRLADIFQAVERALQTGQQIYWVCPLIEESEKTDLAAAEERFASLFNRFGNTVGLLHGRMKAAEKQKIMADFQAGKLSILVSTTVIEVGVNVPNASLMIIDHGERFGLSQLHQLRGRVGRGTKQSYCFILYGQPLTPFAQARLKTLRESQDGFVLAEKDLQLRGAGDTVGVQQSGLPTYHFANLLFHADCLKEAHLQVKTAAQTLNNLDFLLHFFDQEDAERFHQGA